MSPDSQYFDFGQNLPPAPDVGVGVFEPPSQMYPLTHVPLILASKQNLLAGQLLHILLSKYVPPGHNGS